MYIHTHTNTHTHRYIYTYVYNIYPPSLQTGSGKTHAMGSGVHSGKVPGLIQMSVAELFKQLPTGATARAYFIQIYEDSVII